MKNNWKKYEGGHPIHPSSTAFWQVKLMERDGEEVFVNAWEYPPHGPLKSSTYEVDMQIPDKLSIVGKDINISLFRYDSLDLPRFKRHAKKIMKALIV